MRNIGYARVSTTGQTLKAQIEKLTSAECSTIFQEKESGAKGGRPQFTKMLESIGAGDVLIVTRLDRLARSTRDLLTVASLLEEKNAKLRSLAEPWADTSTAAGKLMLTIMGGLAEFERSLIIERTAEGREISRRAGRKLGRPSKLSRHQLRLASKWRNEGQSKAEIARTLGVSRSTISRQLAVRIY